MPEVALARREGVELIRTGTWGASTGTWTPTAKDIKAAVEAMRCPAVGKPILKIGHLDKRFASGNDGEPGIGWVDNLRVGEDGNLLLGDYVGVPAWIDKVMASAWPKRSIEGRYNYRCALSHTHDFALDAVSLLGTTRPAIPTLKSLNDVAELYGVDIAAAEDDSGESVYAVVAAAEVHTGAMVALMPTAEDAERLAVEGGEPAGELHVTLAYLGEAADLGDAGQQDVIDAVSSAANGLPQVGADLFSVNVFNPPGMTSDDGRDRDTCLVWGLSGDLIDAVHTLISEALWQVPMPQQHRPWHAHMTAAYTDDLSRIGELAGKVGPVTFDRIRLAFGGKHIDIPLIGEPEPLDDDPDEVAAAEGDDDQLKQYWLGPALKRWATKKHPWTTLYRLLLGKVKNADKAKRIASSYYRAHFGHMPNQKGVKAGADSPGAEHALRVEWAPDADRDDLVKALKAAIDLRYSASDLPAAEPEQPINEEDPVSLSDDMRSRLGLADDADETAALAAIDALKVAAEKTPEPVGPSPEQVAASQAAEAERDELKATVEKLTATVEQVSTELAAVKAEKAATVKASVIGDAMKTGKIKPADKAQWESDYDEAPGVTTRILASIAPGTAVPVTVAGTTGDPEPVMASTGTLTDDDYNRIFGITEGV